MTRYVLLGVLIALAPHHAGAVESYDTVLNSPHNFFARSDFPIGSRVCYGCHAEGPRRGAAALTAPPTDGAAAPEVPASSGAPFPSDTETEPPPPLWQRGAKSYTVAPTAGGSSTVCLGCHDGVLGREVHLIGRPDAPVFDHPYDVVYPRRANGQFVPERPTVNQYRYWSIPDLRRGELVLPTGPTSSAFTLPAGSAIPSGHVVRTLEGRVQCDSCHDPHDNGSAPFLRAPAHDLCLICHNR